MDEDKKFILIVLGFIGLALLMLFIGPWLTMITWNFVMPYLFGLPTINFWMAMAINWLSATLFKTVSISKK